MCEEEGFVWVTWVEKKNSSYNNKTHKIPKETLVDPPAKLEHVNSSADITTQGLDTKYIAFVSLTLWHTLFYLTFNRMFLEDGESVCTDISNGVNNHLIPNRSLLRYRYSDLHSENALSPNTLDHLLPHSLSSHTHNNCQLFSSRSLSSASLSSRSLSRASLSSASLSSHSLSSASLSSRSLSSASLSRASLSSASLSSHSLSSSSLSSCSLSSNTRHNSCKALYHHNSRSHSSNMQNHSMPSSVTNLPPSKHTLLIFNTSTQTPQAQQTLAFKSTQMLTRLLVF
ncbi:hypothetical protein GBAR_LOCUS19386 [Geodia barretti]|uniref:Uncharacterized protein n=1 Tax=Geodia barretti TaxID=519541 RepID=A0AA35X1K4_GEOBA|nr:hypothetical protein GBAR_LOCUS19386 [Geodia barretti]